MARFTLGISAYAHDSSAALLQDGALLAMAEEERFNREKHSGAFPEKAIRFCLAQAGIELSQVDEFAFFWQPQREIWGNLRHFVTHLPVSLHLLSSPSGGEMRFLERIARMRSVGDELAYRFSLAEPPRVHFVEHHLAHAASAFFLSGFSESAILTLDGRGESTSTMLAAGKGREIQKLEEIAVPHSLGHFYAAITHYLGFTPFFDEWKVMGLSAYGSDRLVPEFEDLLCVNESGYRLNLEYFRFHTHGQKEWLSPKFYSRFGPARAPGSEPTQREFDIAFALQKTLEKAALALCRRLGERTQARHLCVAGGVGLNCLMNSRIAMEGGFEKVFFQPVANDSGASLGAALYLARPEPSALKHLFWGPEFSPEQMEHALQKSGLAFRKPARLAAEVAAALAAGKIVGWFQGRMEGGPRALGNRSLLADPSRPEMKDRLNALVKKRESFRPFAPAVTQEACVEFFELPQGTESPFMMLTAMVREEMRAKLPAITHFDGSARVQTVSREQNPKFHELLSEFGRLKGVPVLLNTSFNQNEPIVCSPEDAISCFRRTEIDLLILGDYWVEK